MADAFCAICCGPMADIRIATKPRSEAFKAAAQRGDDRGENKDIHDEEESYDCEIISKEDTAVAFLASFGEYQPDGTVSFEDSPDGSFTLHGVGNDTNYFNCYYVDVDDSPNKEPAFPFHASCYWILQRRLSDRDDGLATMDKDVLYSLMRPSNVTNLLDIDYGSINTDWGSEYWKSFAGEEVFVSNPGLVKGLEGRIQEMMVTGKFHLPAERAEVDLSHGVQHDPFQSLSFDILVGIAEQLDDPECFMNWASASWSIQTLVRSAQDEFWKRAIRKQMAWFFELHRCLDDDELCRSSSMRAVFLWAACGSELRVGNNSRLWAPCNFELRFGMKGGEFLRLANRRRIWTSPCKDLTDQYCKMLPHYHLLGEGGGRNRDLLLSKASCRRMYDVSHNEQARLYTQTQECLWIDKWEDTYAKTQLVEAFFMQNSGFLTGIAVSTDGGECKLIGSIDEEEPLRFEAVIPVEDWICGMVLHIPAIEFVGTTRVDVGETSPKGITADIPVTTFNCLGLITLLNEDLHDRRILPDSIIRRRHPLIDEVMWKDNGTRFFGTPYWNNPDIRIVSTSEYDLGVVDDDEEAELAPHLLPYEALIWAKDATELRQLKRVSIFTTYSRGLYTDGNTGTVRTESYTICGLGAEFVDEHNGGQRLIGVRGKIEEDKLEDNILLAGPPVSSTSPDTKMGEKKGHGDFRIDLDIDGPGGEIITEVLIGCYQDESVTGFRVRTNRGREAGCHLNPNVGESELMSIKAQPNKTLVGVVATFPHGCGESKDEGLRELTSLEGISMRLGTKEETAEESSEEDYDYNED
ncbi:hypothetical protein ACLOAV_006914 [Pseudogymnoascus australis]